MTTTDRAQANADVAQAMGWTDAPNVPYAHIDVFPWLDSDGNKRRCVPDLYADTDAGAKAREEAETWLERRGYQVLTWLGMDGRWSAGLKRCLGDLITLDIGYSDRHEARAEAIVRAFKALSGV